MLVWHDSNTDRTKILEYEHEFEHKWGAYSSPGAGRGVVTVFLGPRPTPPRLMHAILKVKGVIQVMSDTLDGKGFFLISVEDPRYWNQLKANIQIALLEEETREDEWE